MEIEVRVKIPRVNTSHSCRLVVPVSRRTQGAGCCLPRRAEHRRPGPAGPSSRRPGPGRGAARRRSSSGRLWALPAIHAANKTATAKDHQRRGAGHRPGPGNGERTATFD